MYNSLRLSTGRLNAPAGCATHGPGRFGSPSCSTRSNTWLVWQRRPSGAVHWPEVDHHDAVRWVGQLLECPERQVKGVLARLHTVANPNSCQLTALDVASLADMTQAIIRSPIMQSSGIHRGERRCFGAENTHLWVVDPLVAAALLVTARLTRRAVIAYITQIVQYPIGMCQHRHGHGDTKLTTSYKLSN
jgi:hypothetical protein